MSPTSTPSGIIPNSWPSPASSSNCPAADAESQLAQQASSRGQQFGLLVLVVCLMGNASGQGTSFLIEDFDGPQALGQRWTAVGAITASRVPAAVSGIDGVAGNLVTCKVQPDAGVFTTSAMPRPPYRAYDTLRFRIRAESASPTAPDTVEVHIVSAERKASFWRKVELTSDAWQIVDIPLRFLRHSGAAFLRWDEVANLGFRFRDEGSFRIDGLELVRRAGSSPYISSQQLGKLAFGSEVRTAGDDQFVVLTDDERVNAEALLGEFRRLASFIYRDFPELRRPPRPVPMLVFAKESSYRAFWPRYAAMHAARLTPVRASGFSLLGVAGSYFDEHYGSVRPVFLHEVCHAILAPATGLSNRSEWLHEGLANYYQLHWSHQDLDLLANKMLRDGTIRPLQEITNGERLPLEDYAQATLFVKWLLQDGVRKKQFRRAVTLMGQNASTALAPVCRPAFGRSLSVIEAEWLQWMKEI